MKKEEREEEEERSKGRRENLIMSRGRVRIDHSFCRRISDVLSLMWGSWRVCALTILVPREVGRKNSTKLLFCFSKSVRDFFLPQPKIN